MKLFFSPASPFARKCLVAAHELGLATRIETVVASAGPVARDATIRQHNPLGQIPTFLTDDGTVLYDSRVICEYLDAEAGGALFGTGATRWRNLTDAALADGLMGAALLARYETALRPEPLRWDGWIEGQFGKITDALAAFEAKAADLDGRLDIGTIGLACGLGYLDLRFPEFAWRANRSGLAAWFARMSERPSMQATRA